MNIKLAKYLVNAVEYIGEEARIYENYSGRGMMGRTTTGIVVEDFSFFVQAILEFVKENPQDNTLKEIDIPCLRWDHLANQIIIY